MSDVLTDLVLDDDDLRKALEWVESRPGFHKLAGERILESHRALATQLAAAQNESERAYALTIVVRRMLRALDGWKLASERARWGLFGAEKAIRWEFAWRKSYNNHRAQVESLLGEREGKA